MRIAYIIVAHTLPDLIERLVRSLDSADCRFYIHYDRKSPVDEVDRLRNRLADIAGVRFLPRHDVHWGGAGSIHASLLGISAALLDDADVAVLLSGQDYPIKPPARIAEILASAAERPHIQHTALPSDLFPGETARFERWHFAARGITLPPRRLAPLLKRRFPVGYRPYRGSAFWALPRDCLTHIETVARRDRHLVDFFNHVFIPDEMFFQTLVMNSPFADITVSDDLHFMDWSGRGLHPATLTQDHLPAMSASPQPFARKVDPRAEPALLDLIDARLLSGAGR